MGPTTTKRNDSKLMSTPSSKNKSHSAISKDNIILNKGRNLVNSFSETELLLQQTRQELLSAQQEIQYLKEQLATAKSVGPTQLSEFPLGTNDFDFGTSDFPAMTASLPPLPLGSSQSQWAKGSPTINIKMKTLPRIRKNNTITPRKIANYVRTFALPSTNQGFQYLYLPARRKYPIKEMRSRLSGLGLEKYRLIHIHYPDSNVVAILLHNGYIMTATNKLAQHQITPITDFDPLSPSILRDPKYKDMETALRVEVIAELHYQRSLQIVNRLRAPLNIAVA
ncbi:hypothetical protein HPULCUR_000475 [Helicostylum pulchrum]|uniref:Uncharacterized protein n=1 Tax=Helicostylum pulchrum TaxID=562976 RepID=A0ABP9XL35_9FUNG